MPKPRNTTDSSWLPEPRLASSDADEHGVLDDVLLFARGVIVIGLTAISIFGVVAFLGEIVH